MAMQTVFLLLQTAGNILVIHNRLVCTLDISVRAAFLVVHILLKHGSMEAWKH
jgi:hypothetical protein